MKRDIKVSRFAKKLVELSKENGVVSESRVSEVLAELKKAAPRNQVSILKVYMEYIRRAVAEQTALVSTPTELSSEALAAIEANFSKIYGRSITATTQTDSSLIAGVKVRVGDDVYDSSVAGHLKRLAETVQ